MTLTAIRPDFGFGNGREVSLFKLAHPSGSISAFSVASAPCTGRSHRGNRHGARKALLIVVGVDHPESNAVRPFRDHFAGLRFEHIYALNFDENIPLPASSIRISGSPNTTNR